MKRNKLPKILVFTLVLSALVAGTAFAQTFSPKPTVPSGPTVQVEYVNTMPSVVPDGGARNLGSPVAIKNKLYLIDQNDAIYRLNGPEDEMALGTPQKIFDVDEAPDGLALDNRQSILNISPGRRANSIYVMFTSASEPTTSIPIYSMPVLPGVICCDFTFAPTPVDDLYRLGTIPGVFFFFGPTRTEYQVLYEYKLAGNSLKNPRAIAAFETQSGPTHNGGGMLTLPDGRVLFATGDALPFGAEGRAAPQEASQHVSKILIIDPDDGSTEVAALGVRNVQHMEYVPIPDSDDLAVTFADIGGVTAEEVNYVPLADLLNTSVAENFGWGRNDDGLAREGTFYLGPGLPLVLGTQPPAVGNAPSPEAGFIQPHAQFGRNNPSEFVAVTGPATSTKSFGSITAVFGDLNSSVLYATEDPLAATNVPVYEVNLSDENGTVLASFQDLVGGRADPRFFRFPDGTAGVLLEATGAFYRLTQVDGN